MTDILSLTRTIHQSKIARLPDDFYSLAQQARLDANMAAALSRITRAKIAAALQAFPSA